MNTNRWSLKVVFDPPHETFDGNDEALAFYIYLREYWDGMLPEELDEHIQLTGIVVNASIDVLDSIFDPITWLLSNTAPKEMHLKREADR